jgi:hypothetical protein
LSSTRPANHHRVKSAGDSAGQPHNRVFGRHRLRNLPLHGFAQNQLWCELVTMACELTAWMQMLALEGPARAWEPKRLRLRLFSAAGRLVRGGRRLRVRLAAAWPWAGQLTAAITRLQALALGCPATTASTTRKGQPQGPWNPAPRRDSPGNQARPKAETATATASAAQIEIAKHRG